MAIKGMVCSSEESFAICVVRDMTNFYHNAENNVKLFPVSSVTVQAFFEEVGRSYQYDPDSFELVLQRHGDNETVTLSENRDKSLKEIGVTYEMGVKNNFIVTELSGPPRRKATTETNEDDMLLGASASPTASGDYAGEYATPPPAAPSLPRAVCSTSKNELTWGCSSIAKHYTVGYVGLVNQAMTCYLNSLLQALFMTPEFRNALYKWEFDGTEQDESKSIPYQLQKLFLQLQTSSKTAVETTELTRSFGWDSSEAWQQHDIQELCRVMFDALEHKFKNTQQADLISRLYEGKMIDYVKCLECSTEKSREDTFLDIPLPVRPYGSEAYGSVEEALRAFVQPETLDGNNQYFCEQCNKKCDAHKGLKFSKFPYLLTLHLKRFDFDYTTLHRIKLNDKVVFPDILDLNSFIINGECKEDEGMLEETIVNKDDSSTTTTDSGSALDDECCHNMEITMNSHETDYQEDDEGIDMSSGPTHQENEKNRRDMLSEKGPYIYELFSIMIHSGSASGGHYYAYIKDFKTMEWFCFNDQTVTRITTEDIKKTYGGGPVRGYYSGAYSSSTNAYMLMYRQIDRSRNCEAMTVKDFPEHIKELLKKMQDKDEQDRLMKEKESEMCKLKLHCRQPAVTDRKMYCMNNETLAEVTKRAYQSLDLEGQVPLEQCRLVSYDSIQDWIECSYEGREDETIHSIMESVHINCKNNMLMEIRKPDETFEVYQKGGVSTRVFVVNLESEDVEGPFSIRGNLSQTVYEFKATIGKILELPVDKMRIVLEKYANEPRPLEDDNRTLKHEGFYGSTKIFVTCCEEDKDTPFMESKLHKIIDRFEHVICLQCVLPDVSKEALEKLQISPDIDVNHNDDNAEADKAAKVLKVNKAAEALLKKKDNLNENVGLWNNSAQPPGDPEDEGIGTTGQSDQSASEDNSLTDSDRTLVGDAPDECHAVLSSHSNSPVISDNPNVSSPEEGDVANNDNGTDILDMIYSQIDTKVKDHKKRLENINFDTSGVGRPPAEADPDISPDNHYFRAIQNTVTENGKLLKVLVDKRMTLGALKKDLEPHVGVPVEYFKIFRLYSSQQEYECARLSESLNSYRDDEQLIIRLGRALRKGEHKGKVYALVPDAKEPAEYICDWIIGKGMKVSDVKKEILEEMKKISGTDMKTYECCRLRKKSWKNPAKVYLDDQIFDDDISLYPNWEIFVQALPYPEPVTSTDQLVVFVRQWCPSAMTLKPFEEIVLDTNKVDELKTKISSISGIHIDNIEIAKAQGTFPCECNILTVHTDLEWSSQVATLDTWPLNIFEDGHVIIYRDKTEELKQLTPEEEKKLSRRDCSRQTKYTPSFSSPRKERALKIYLDSSPKKHDDLDVD